MNIKRMVRPNVRSLKAYEAKEIPCRVKLDANESPYGFKIKIKGIQTNRYPDPETKGLKRALSREVGVKTSNILIGNGSDELIYYLITTFGGPVLYPTPTFSMYGIIAKALGEAPNEVSLNELFDLDLPKMLSAVKDKNVRLVFLSSPNNPTGNCFSSDKILKIISSSKNALVVVDEAYQPFSSVRGFVPLLKDHKNLLILRTLSKIGLAGLRVGLLVAHEEAIEEVNKVRLPFNLNSVSQAVAIQVLNDRKRMDSYISSIVMERERLYKGLERINGIKPYPSEANFILFKIKDPDRAYKGLLKKGVLVRNMKGQGCLRVTVGTKKESEIFLKALKEVVVNY